ncbi:hypothetical protein DL96DRAFT_268127 [Flagelloscypha sp. PMI_526]|nr:hypothetical protein DL96DRAFT_268127 [Flagelloscypha sp. PMI_526]
MPFSVDITSTPLRLPPLPAVVDGNRVPSSVELAQIRHSITTSQTAISDINALRDLLDTLRRTDALLAHKENVKTLRKRLWDANILPTDVWREIFHWVVAFSPAGIDRPFVTPRAPLILSQVCHNWRHSVCRLSCLWAEIYIDPFDGPVSTGTVNLLGLFLTRSFPASLHVSLNLAEGWSDFTEEEQQRTKQVAYLAASQAFRWRTASLILPLSVWKSTMTFPVVSPLLEAVFFSCEDGNNSETGAWTQPIFTRESAPMLKSVCIGNLIPTPATLRQFLPWSSLHKVKVDAPPDSTHRFGLLESLGILQWTTDLESVDLDFYNHQPPPIPATSPRDIVCPNLRRIQLTTYQGKIFDHFSAPQLHELTFWSGPGDVDMMTSFIRKSPQLTVLQVHGSNISFLSDLSLPKLETLTLVIEDGEDFVELLDLLALLPSDTFPLLGVITIELFMRRILRTRRHDQDALMLRLHGAIINLATSAIVPASAFQKINLEVDSFEATRDIIRTILQSLHDVELEGLFVDLE